MRCLVIGRSISGVAAALELAAHGQVTYWVDYTPDTVVIPELFLIDATPLTPQVLSALEYEDIARDAICQAGVRSVYSQADFILSAEKLVQEPSGRLVLLGDRASGTLEIDVAVFAPGGSEPGLRDELGAERFFFGKGLSYSAWADAQFFRNRRVAVIGCGDRAVEQACILLQNQVSVSVVCEGPEVACRPSLQGEFARIGRENIWTDARIVSIDADAEGRPSALRLTQRRVEQSAPTAQRAPRGTTNPGT